MGELFEMYAYAVIIGVIAIASAVTYLAKLIGFGDHAFVSPLIGSVLGIVVALLFPTAYIAAFVVAGVVSLLSNIILSKVW
jgi:hypothetical protein